MVARPDVDALILRVLVEAVRVCPKANMLLGDTAVGGQIADALARLNYTDELIDKIFYKNNYEFVKSNF